MLEYEKELWGHFLYSIPVHPIYNTMIAYGIAKIMEAVSWNEMNKILLFGPLVCLGGKTSSEHVVWSSPSHEQRVICEQQVSSGH